MPYQVQQEANSTDSERIKRCERQIETVVAQLSKIQELLHQTHHSASIEPDNSAADVDMLSDLPVFTDDHYRLTGAYSQTNKLRFSVPVPMMKWAVLYADYKPVKYTADKVLTIDAGNPKPRPLVWYGMVWLLKPLIAR